MERALLFVKEIHPERRFINQWFQRLGAPITTAKPELPDNSMRLEVRGRILLENVANVVPPSNRSKPSSSEVSVVPYYKGSNSELTMACRRPRFLSGVLHRGCRA